MTNATMKVPYDNSFCNNKVRFLCNMAMCGSVAS